MTWSNPLLIALNLRELRGLDQVRGGTIVPLQQPAMTTGEVRHSPLTLVVALQQEVIVRCHLCCEPMVCKDAVSKSIIASLTCKHLPLHTQASTRRHVVRRYAVRWASNFLRLLHLRLPGQVQSEQPALVTWSERSAQLHSRGIDALHPLQHGGRSLAVANVR
jgi:hypothetical protein